VLITVPIEEIKKRFLNSEISEMEKYFPVAISNPQVAKGESKGSRREERPKPEKQKQEESKQDPQKPEEVGLACNILGKDMAKKGEKQEKEISTTPQEQEEVKENISEAKQQSDKEEEKEVQESQWRAAEGSQGSLKVVRKDRRSCTFGASMSGSAAASLSTSSNSPNPLLRLGGYRTSLCRLNEEEEEGSKRMMEMKSEEARQVDVENEKGEDEEEGDERRKGDKGEGGEREELEVKVESTTSFQKKPLRSMTAESLVRTHSLKQVDDEKNAKEQESQVVEDMNEENEESLLLEMELAYKLECDQEEKKLVRKVGILNKKERTGEKWFDCKFVLGKYSLKYFKIRADVVRLCFANSSRCNSFSC